MNQGLTITTLFWQTDSVNTEQEGQQMTLTETLATAKQVARYDALLTEAVDLDPALAEKAKAAREVFPALSTTEASERIRKAIATCERLRSERGVTRTVPVPGKYTVPQADGHRTLRVEVMPADAKFAAGKTVISFLSGSDNTSDYTGFAFVEDDGTLRVWKRFVQAEALLAAAHTLLEDPAAVLVSQHCRRCNRDLTVPASLHNGLGPECARKVEAGK